MTFKATARLLVIAGLLPLALVACREEEQDRPLTFEKGVYSGQADETLTEETTRELNQRALQQSF